MVPARTPVFHSGRCRSERTGRSQRQTFFNTFKLGKNDQVVAVGYSHCCV